MKIKAKPAAVAWQMFWSSLIAKVTAVMLTTRFSNSADMLFGGMS